MSAKKSNIIKSSAKKPVVRSRISATYRGPIPTANELQKYENASPGAADRIIKMAEEQAKHRQNLEKQVVQSNVVNERLGMYFAFFLTVFMVSVGTYLIMKDKPVVGFFTLFIPSIFQAGNYAYTKYREHRESEEQKETGEIEQTEQTETTNKKLLA